MTRLPIRVPIYMRCPKGWKNVTAAGHNADYPGCLSQHWFRSPDDLLVCCAMERELDTGREWLHVSFSRADATPSYADLALVRETFIGLDRMSVQFFPPREEYVNLHEHCLHLWAPCGFELLTPPHLGGV